MNSTELDHQLRQFLTSMSESRAYFPVVILAIVLSVLLLAALIFMSVKSNRSASRLYRLLFRFANQHDSSPRTIASPDDKGRFHPPIWCNTCNDHVDHVDNMCPHIGRKLFASSQNRRFYDVWRRQLHCRYHQSVNGPKPNTTVGVPNVTIDLDELLCHGTNGHSIDRRASTSSFDSIGPCHASTPDGDRFQRRMQRQETKLARIRSKIQSWASRRRASSDSSGIGSSIGSVDDEPQVHTTALIKRMVAKPRRWVSDLTGAHQLPKVPKVVIQQCSTRRRPTVPIQAFEMDDAGKFLRVNVAWNGPHAASHRSGMRRAFSQPGDESRFNPRVTIRRSQSAGAASMHLPVCTHAQQPYFDQPVLVHASPTGQLTKLAVSAVALPNIAPVPSDPHNRSFSDYF